MSRYSFNTQLPRARPRPAAVALLLFSAACISRDPAPPAAALHSAALQKGVVQVARVFGLVTP